MAVCKERNAVVKKGLRVAAALCVALCGGMLSGCGGDEAESAPVPARDSNMPAADAELLDYINAYFDDYEDAVSLDGIPSDVIISASEQMQAQKEATSAKDADTAEPTLDSRQDDEQN